MRTINQKIDAKIEKGQLLNNETEIEREQLTQEINKCNYYASEISKEIAAIVKYVKQIYNKKMP